MSDKEQIIWTSFKTELAQPGKRVLTYPNHRGEVEMLTIEDVDNHRILLVDANRKFRYTRLDGRRSEKYDTSYDIGLIER